MIKRLFLGLSLMAMIILLSVSHPGLVSAGTGDTTVVQTFRFDTNMRAGVFQFPDDSSKTYEKIIMLYSMRCKNGLISNSANPNQGCGEWDYNCYTHMIDSSQTDSVARTQPSFVMTNVTDTVIPYSSQMLYDYIQTHQQEVNILSTISETNSKPSDDTIQVQDPLGGSSSVKRFQCLWTAAELLNAGLTAGPVTGIKLDVVSGNSTIENLRVRLRHTVQDSLDANRPEISGFTECYYLNTAVNTSGTLALHFSTPFNWNGASNLLVDFSYSLSSTPSTVINEAHVAGFTSSLSSASADGYLNFAGNAGRITVDPVSFGSITNEISIAFWAYGDSLSLPMNTIAFWGNDLSGNRTVNIHLPYGDSKIYWDCGNNGSTYDRISKLALPAEYEGRWNFWTFTKDATLGVMAIYLNGVLWYDGFGTTLPINLNRLWIGMAPNNLQYRGNLDEVSVWNKALDTTAIKSIMYSSITSAHPLYNNLKAYYRFDEMSGSIALDGSPYQADAPILNPARRQHRGADLFRNFSGSGTRPDVTFVQGVYTTSTQSFSVLDSVPRNANRLIDYSVTGNSLVVGDTNYVWNARGYVYIYSASGLKVDSVLIQPTDTAFVTTLNYHEKRPMNIELINFITPYGLGLDLDGLKGKTWEFDVTDYAPLLRGPRYMAMHDGKYQEDNDIKFVFYEGTPPRDVHSVSQIWPNAHWIYPSWSQIYNDVYFKPVSVKLDSASSMYKIRSAISGHGQQGEFIARNHTIRLNNSIDFTRSVWTECATNPIYPQGGTWVYDRAGWCPGAAVDVKEYELTPFVNPGQTVTLDYTMPFIASPGQTNYRVNHQLVTYGPPNFTNDAAVSAIKSPSVRTEYLRFNSICDDPVIIIRNTGSDTLTTLDITYGREGGVMSTMTWNGNLPFLATEEVVLPSPDWYTSGIDRFIVSVDNPNGVADQYPANDTMSTDFLITDTYYDNIVLRYEPNALYTQNTYRLTDSQGNILLTRTAPVGGIIMKDTLRLPTGCYSLYMSDSGDDGLEFWNNPNQGAGTFQIYSAVTGTLYKNFEPDFGDNINYQFTLNVSMSAPEIAPAVSKFELFPNPSDGRFAVAISSTRNSRLSLHVYDITGRIVKTENLRMASANERFELDLDDSHPGIYLVVLEGNGVREMRRIVVQ